MHVGFAVRLRIGPVAASLTQIEGFSLKDNSPFTQHTQNMCAT